MNLLALCYNTCRKFLEDSIFYYAAKGHAMMHRTIVTAAIRGLFLFSGLLTVQLSSSVYGP